MLFDVQQSDEIPNRKELEERFRRRTKLSYFVLTLIAGCDVFLILELFIFESVLEIRIIAFISLCVALFVHVWPAFQLIFISKIDLDDLEPAEFVGEYSATEIREIFQELFNPYRKKEIPSVYVIEDPAANAFVINSSFFDSIKSLNAVYVSRSLFSILEKNEIKAIVSHELAHFYKYIYPIHRIWLPTAVFFGLVPIYFLTKFGSIGDYYLLTGVLVYSGAVFLVHPLQFSSDKTLEFLSDVYAAERYGKLDFVNSLLTLGKHTEFSELLLEHVLTKLRKDKQLSFDDFSEIVEAIEIELGGIHYSKSELIAAIDSAFSTARLMNFRKRLGRVKRYFENRKLDESLEYFANRIDFELVDWELFDFAESDFRISENEYPYLIETLIRNPDKQLFHLTHDNKELAVNLSHPTVRNRILFIEKSLD